MLGLTGTLNYYLFNGSIDMRKGVYGLSDVVRHEMKQHLRMSISLCPRIVVSSRFFIMNVASMSFMRNVL